MRVEEVKEHLISEIIPFWESLKDDTYGGFYGGMDYNLKLEKMAVKGGILNSRILWFFANAYTTTSEKSYLSYAAHAYEFLKKAFLDKEYGGIYWSVTYDGKPEDDTKHTYNQAFAIYALASYYGATGDEEALKIAYGLVDKVETICKDEIGYLEAFDRSFNLQSNEKLSENNLMAIRTMNTLLHLFEAYSELYSVDKNEKIAGHIKWMLDIVASKVYNPEKRRLEVFFDFEMNSLTDLNSYGHDIEAAWLIDRGCEILGDKEYSKKMSVITKDLTSHILSVVFDGNSLNNECFKQEVDDKKVWWVQAEAILGFINGYQKDGSKQDYLDAAGRIWDFTKNNIVDQRPGSEWLSEIYADGTPNKYKEIVGPWKCPYHNGRMCFEVIKRNVEF